MTLEQQVASLVNATTELTSVVNGELELVRLENNNFKQSTLASLDEFVGKTVRNSSFTVYVDPSSGSSVPINPINNNLNPFNTIANAISFLKKYYWSTGYVKIKLSSGVHLVLSEILVDSPCPIEIEGYSSPDLSGVNAIVSQTTLGNQQSAASVPGSNANLFNYLYSAFQSHIVTRPGASAFTVKNTFLKINSCFFYSQDKQINQQIATNAITLVDGAFGTIGLCAFMYNHHGIALDKLSWFKTDGVVISSGNYHGIRGGNGVAISDLYTSGNLGYGIFIYDGQLSFLGNCYSHGNGVSGVYCYMGAINVLSLGSNTLISSCANGGDGFTVNYGIMNLSNSYSRNNSSYGYRSFFGMIKTSANSDGYTTGNSLGKKMENNSLQSFVVGISL